MPDVAEAFAALRKLPRPVVIGALALVLVVVACSGSDVGARTIGFELSQGR